MASLSNETLVVAGFQVTVELLRSYIKDMRESEKLKEAEEALEDGNYKQAERLVEEAQDGSITTLSSYIIEKIQARAVQAFEIDGNSGTELNYAEAINWARSHAKRLEHVRSHARRAATECLFCEAGEIS